MLIVRFLRWLFGYNRICISGRFPERFLNLATRHGIILWELQTENNELFADIKRKETEAASAFAGKAECQLSIVSERGLPYICLKYRNRFGLLIGAILASVLCCYLSCCIWSIKINAPDGINEYEIRRELYSLGFHEGIIYRQDHLRDIETKLSMNDKRISWVSINVAGTNATVEMSASIPGIKNDDKKTVSNLISKADGTITKISVRKGSSIVKIGEGVHKGQLIVSGIAALPDGSSRFYDSDGEIYASTYRTAELTLPKNIIKTTITDTDSDKLNISFFGITFPVSFNGTPQGNHIFRTEKSYLTLLDQEIPLKSSKQSFFPITDTQITFNKAQAEKILNNRFKLYKLFLTGNSTSRIIGEKSVLCEDKNNYRLKVFLTVEENICEKSYISIKELS